MYRGYTLTSGVDAQCWLGGIISQFFIIWAMRICWALPQKMNFDMAWVNNCIA